MCNKYNILFLILFEKNILFYKIKTCVYNIYTCITLLQYLKEEMT